jgi:Mn-dependent DtxR family transcriptional regulator
MDAPDLSDLEATVLQAVHAEGSADLYDLARVVGTGPRSVQEAVRRLSDERLVIVAERGVEVHCTPAGTDLVQTLNARNR